MHQTDSGEVVDSAECPALVPTPQKMEDKAKLIRLIHSYKTARPHRARALLVSINRVIDKYMGA